MKKIIVILVVVILVALGFAYKKLFMGKVGTGPVTIGLENEGSGMKIVFDKPKKSAHYENNTPNHAEIVPVPPVNVVLDFNFDLAKLSDISIKKDGKEYGQGETMIDANKLSMRKDMDASAPDGLYLVAYKACWPDASCHDGQFQFAVDRSKRSEYKDMRGQKEVSIDMVNFDFAEKKILVSRGTKITWINKDAAIHYVNTDPHPQHTYYPAQNSPELSSKNKTYSQVFDKAGWFPYHCSAHARSMTADILVE